MSASYRVDELVPHADRMCLLSSIVDYGDDWLQAEVEITPDSMFADARGVPAWIGLEYLAQTIAAYSGLQERRHGGQPKIGLLLGTRRYSCNVERFEFGQKLRLRVSPEVVADNGLNVFDCELQGEGVRATAMINVFQPDDAEAFLNEATQ